jgi:ketosteroid isomerase-like protein
MLLEPEDVVRAYFAAYSEGRPERFDEVVSRDYVDYSHTPPGHGTQGARDDCDHATCWRALAAPHARRAWER